MFLKVLGYTFRGSNSSISSFASFLSIGSTLKGKNLLFEQILSFKSRLPFGRVSLARKANRKSWLLSPFEKKLPGKCGVSIHLKCQTIQTVKALPSLMFPLVSVCWKFLVSMVRWIQKLNALTFWWAWVVCVLWSASKTSYVTSLYNLCDGSVKKI